MSAKDLLDQVRRLQEDFDRRCEAKNLKGRNEAEMIAELTRLLAVQHCSEVLVVCKDTIQNQIRLEKELAELRQEITDLRKPSVTHIKKDDLSFKP